MIAGARRSAESRDFADMQLEMKRGRTGGFRRENTTLAVVATNARFTKLEASKIAQLAQLGVARSIWPANTMSDGDVVIALSLGERKAPIDTVGVAAAEALSSAAIRAVKLAPTLGGVPGLAGAP